MKKRAKKGKRILINGTGTVGVRDADVLASLGVPLALSKYDVQENVRTEELKRLISRYPDADIEIYAARGKELQARKRRFKKVLGRCDGGIDDLDFSKDWLAIDCTEFKDTRVFNEVYRPNRIDFAINGAGDNMLVRSLFFASVPNSSVAGQEELYRMHNAKIVSCNTHCVTTAVGLVKEALGEDIGPKLRDPVSVTFSRRQRDPHTGPDNQLDPEVKFQHKQYHVEEVESLHPDLFGLVDTTLGTFPVEYFHTLEMTFDFKQALPKGLADDVRREISAYPRAILAEGVLSHQKTINSAKVAHIEDGDIPFPVYMVEPAGKYKLKIFALTPQRGIVSASTADYVLMRSEILEGVSTLDEAFTYVNENARWRGRTFNHIASSVQDNLRNYEEQVLPKLKEQ